MARVKIGGFPSPGYIADEAPYTLPVNAFTEVQNVRFTPSGAVAIGGHTEVLAQAPVTPYWVKPFPPITAPIWVVAGLTAVYAYDTVYTNISRAVGGAYTATVAERWHGDVMNGLGFFNNTLDVPQYWSAFSSATLLQNLPNWPSTLRAKFLRPHKFFLFAGHTIESGQPRPYRLRWCHPAAPGTIPSSWALGDPTVDSGEFDIAETEDYLVDGLTLGDLFIVYKQHNVHAVQYVGRPSVFGQFKIISGRGLLHRDCVHAFSGGHFVAGVDDIYIHTGQRNSDQSLVESRLRNWIFNQIDEDNYFNCYVVDYPRRKESWFCFPEAGEIYPTLAVVWNRNRGGIGIRELFSSPFIATGPVPPVGLTPRTWSNI